jgi:DNA helicase HerA-like ATPase
VFAADIKGDLSGIAVAGTKLPHLVKRANEIGLGERFGNAAFPVAFWDVFGQQGHPVRATVQEMGPLLLSRLLELTEPQEGVLNIAFRWAEDERANGDPNMAILDMQDLRSIIDEMGKRASELRSKYGNIAPQTVGVLQRRLLVLEQQGATNFFGEPAHDIMDFLKTAPDGRGMINILSAEKLMNTPRLYSTFLLWMLSELFKKLPEVGDLEKPKLVFLFDEAHLLFNGASQAVLDQIERVTRLIRSKGVGVYYVTQSPGDVPDRVSAQLGNRIQHALRAFTPKEQKAVRTAAQTFRPNPEFAAERVIQELGVGEALVSVLVGNGQPSVVQRTLIRPPMSRVGPLNPEERQALIEADTENRAKYKDQIDSESAHERLIARNSPMGQVRSTLKRFSNIFGKG